MPYTNGTTVSPNTKEGAVEAIEARVITGLNPGSQAHVTIVDPTIHPKSTRHMAKNAFTVINKGTSLNFVIPSNLVNLLDPM